jgi:hypothetical protein
MGQMKYTKTIAPRLYSGECRDTYSGGLPPHIREGLRKIAKDERQSVSWVLEQIIIDHFPNLRKPRYVERKKSGETRKKRKM